MPFEVLRRKEVLSPLSARSIQLIVAVQPQSLPELVPLLESCRDLSVEVGLWPLLDDRLGRWPNDINVEAFRAHLFKLLEQVSHLAVGPREIVFDLEPPIATTRRLLELRLWDGRVRLRPANLTVAATQFITLVDAVRSSGMTPTAVVTPLVVYDAERRQGGWQRLLGTPVESVGFDRIAVMAYTSLFEAYSRGALARRDARALLGRLCLRARQRWRERATIALGVVGGGALGDEVPYRDPAELGDDVAIARAAGVDDLSLFGLTGVLSRSPSPERWLDVFAHTEAAVKTPAPTPRTRAVELGVTLAGHLVEAYSRRLPLQAR